MICGMCEDESVARVDVITVYGVAAIECCEVHLVDGYTAALVFCPAPAIVVHEGCADKLALEFITELEKKKTG